MAVTSGQGNPNWSKDETILALDLYFTLNGEIPGPQDKRIISLSKILNSLPLHPIEMRKRNFRNPAGVAFKLQNIRSVAIGKGLKNTSKMDKLIWNKFGDESQIIHTIAKSILESIKDIKETKEINESIEDNETFNEGKILTYIHKKRERSPNVRKTIIKKRKENNNLKCDICGLIPKWTQIIKEEDIFECHHIEPLSDRKERKTKESDIALLCANCHKAIHSVISSQQKWITPDDFKKMTEIDS